MHVCLINLKVGYSIPLCGIDRYETDAKRVKVTGKNGLGKTTLLLGLGGLRSTVRGQIEIDGSRTSETTRANISGVMSDAVAIPNTTVSQVVHYISAIAAASFPVQSSGGLPEHPGRRESRHLGFNGIATYVANVPARHFLP